MGLKSVGEVARPWLLAGIATAAEVVVSRDAFADPDGVGLHARVGAGVAHITASKSLPACSACVPYIPARHRDLAVTSPTFEVAVGVRLDAVLAVSVELGQWWMRDDAILQNPVVRRWFLAADLYPLRHVHLLAAGGIITSTERTYDHNWFGYGWSVGGGWDWKVSGAFTLGPLLRVDWGDIGVGTEGTLSGTAETRFTTVSLLVAMTY